ncbi:MAG: thiamine pyrophosphate-dependent enzyme, partial [Candidatus Paceibacterales bacterium]
VALPGSHDSLPRLILFSFHTEAIMIAICGTMYKGIANPGLFSIALAAKKDKKSHRVFVLMSDGECDEGSVWEAALFASHLKLDNVIAIIDYNKIQSFGKTNEVLNLEPLKQKWESFGWQVTEVDGHDYQKLEKTFNALPFKNDCPNLIIAHTQKGKGISFMENKLEWHYKSPSKEQYDAALKELHNHA